MKEWNYENEQWTKLPAHLKHLPLFTRHIDWTSMVIRFIWSIVLKRWFFKFYIRLKVKGSFRELYEKYPKLIIISNHASHLDATSIAAAIPYRYWPELYITAAKDYFFTNPLFTFFSAHCLGAIPIERKDKKGETVKLIITLLRDLDRMWMIFFPEGTRSKDGKVQDFKRGVAIFSEKTKTPVLFLFIEGNSALWPKGAWFAKPGPLVVHVGPVVQPGPVEAISEEYRKWASSIDPKAFEPETNIGGT